MGHENLPPRNADPMTTAPDGYGAVIALNDYCTKAIGQHLNELLKLRASHLNGCSFCLDMHTREALAAGETQEWVEATETGSSAAVFDDREKAVIDLTDAVTRLGEDGVPDEVWQRIEQHFTEKEALDLVLGIGTINVWNRLAITLRLPIPKR